MDTKDDTPKDGNGRFDIPEAEAERRFRIHRQKDPYPGILPALLNSADIEDYVNATGMIWPFHQKSLKPASYEASILGKVILWDEKGKDTEIDLTEGEKFVLEPNSIAFVTPEPKFRLPDYMALRFNLRITNVHRGLLLGTGPLIDPGFEGNLLIPLHNLTTNKYTFRGGEPLIWIEFTKLSKNERWDGNGKPTAPPPRIAKFVDFPQNKKYLPPRYYLSQASPNQPIRSSIPHAMLDAQRSARLAQRTVRNMTIGGLAAAVIVSYGLYSSFSQMNALVQDTASYVSGAQKGLYTLRSDVNRMTSLYQGQKEKSAAMERKIESLRKTLTLLTDRLAAQAKLPEPPPSQASQPKRFPK